MPLNEDDPAAPPHPDDAGVLTERTVLERTHASSLDCVKRLSLYGMALADVSIIRRLTQCEIISLVGNRVTTLLPFAACTRLSELFLRRNEIADFAELRHLAGLRLLHTLWLCDNPIAERPSYREAVCAALPQLQLLDDKPAARGRPQAAGAGDEARGEEGDGAEAAGGVELEQEAAVGVCADDAMEERWDLDEPRASEPFDVIEELVADGGEGVAAEGRCGEARGDEEAASEPASVVSSEEEAEGCGEEEADEPLAGFLAGTAGAALIRSRPPQSGGGAAEPPRPLGGAAGGDSLLDEYLCRMWEVEGGRVDAALPAEAARGGEKARKPPAGAASGARQRRRKPSGGGAPPAARRREGGGRRAAGASGAFGAAVRCAVRVGGAVWAAERDGCVVVRDGQTAAVVERIMVGLHHLVWCLAPVGKCVWCGSETGPILMYDAKSYALRGEARGHSKGVHCMAAATTCKASGEGASLPEFVCSGGADWRLNMWSAEGKFKKQFSGHTGAVRCVVVLGMEIWSGSDDGTVRVWDAAYGLFNLSSEPCRNVLSGHRGSVLALLPYMGAILSSGADGAVRSWNAGGAHEALLHVDLSCGPIGQLVPMGRSVWVAAQDGSVLHLDGTTLQVSGSRPKVHAGYVSGLCTLSARTTRQCWSYSLADETVRMWKVEEIETQRATEVGAAIYAQLAAAEGQLAAMVGERREERQRWEAERAALDEEEARLRAELEQSHAAQCGLMEELAANMRLQEEDMAEAERLRRRLTEEEAVVGALQQAREEDAAALGAARREAAEARAAAEASEARACEAEAALAALTAERDAERQRTDARLEAARAVACRAIASRVRERLRSTRRGRTTEWSAEEEHKRVRDGAVTRHDFETFGLSSTVDGSGSRSNDGEMPETSGTESLESTSAVAVAQFID
ncbi:hypothetical protein AB1Y20_000522 [Prymnesium parvum]|uniref:Leucine-rich repeat and WD repeat-containing protein 1 n=1 Tax=Prymnesium parvum TaxID=97485 RepID=A0AB34K6S8_PRYPA